VIEPREPSVTDLARLQMENELLSLEVGHLRARLKTYDQLSQSEKDAKRRLQQLQKRHEVVLQDMRRLLRRLNSSPAGPLFRRWKGFNVLFTKYGEAPPR
jgi:hypothetical protein